MAQWNERRRLMSHVHSPHWQPRLHNVDQPNLLRSVFPYEQVPVIDFDHAFIVPEPPARLLITDTTFRDGQQARPPYSAQQIAKIYGLLGRLSGPRGIIRQTEFFLYSDKDRRAIDFCRELDQRFPEITGWIRADKADLKLVKEMGLTETGMLVSVSDYHIFLKLGLTRDKAMDKYLGMVKEALSMGIKPRCHFEDITRSDIYGFVVPLAVELMKLSQESGIDVKIRLCDTMGYGVPYPGAALPRSVGRLVRAMIDEAGVPGQQLEWHGHNDFHKVLVNAATAWLYGCGAVNCALFGLGERTGNTPLEGAVMEYISLTGETAGMDTTAITDLANFFQSDIGHKLPANYPFVGADFNATAAGVHADGLIKNEEIYNIFDTKKILGRPVSIIINDKSGTAGVAYWVNNHLGLTGETAIDKRHPGVVKIHKKVMDQYGAGRTTSISADEMIGWARKYLSDYFTSTFDALKQRAGDMAIHLIESLIEDQTFMSLDPDQMQPRLDNLLSENPFIQYAYAVRADGRMILCQAMQVADRAMYQEVPEDQDYSDRAWFQAPLADGRVHVTDFYTSRYTHKLCITVSGPIRDQSEDIVAVLGADIRFEDLVKLENGNQG